MKKTKNVVLIVSGIGSVLILSFLSLVLNDSCGLNKVLCKDIYTTIMSFLFIFPFVFLFSLITYFLKEEIFHSWIKFTYVWVPFSMFLVFIIPRGGGNAAFPSLIDNQLVAILMSGLYIIISLIMIIWLSIKYYWLKKI